MSYRHSGFPPPADPTGPHDHRSAYQRQPVFPASEIYAFPPQKTNRCFYSPDKSPPSPLWEAVPSPYPHIWVCISNHPSRQSDLSAPEQPFRIIRLRHLRHRQFHGMPLSGKSRPSDWARKLPSVRISPVPHSAMP